MPSHVEPELRAYGGLMGLGPSPKALKATGARAMAEWASV